MLVQEGAEEFGKILVQGDNIIVPSAGNFYVGVCDQTPDFADTLTDISTEPTSAGGYARLPVTRDATGWPTIDVVNGEVRWLSKNLTFAASGADYSRAFTRLFLCNVASCTAGKLFCISGAYSSDMLLLDGQNKIVRFELYP